MICYRGERKTDHIHGWLLLLKSFRSRKKNIATLVFLSAELSIWLTRRERLGLSTPSGESGGWARLMPLIAFSTLRHFIKRTYIKHQFVRMIFIRTSIDSWNVYYIGVCSANIIIDLAKRKFSRWFFFQRGMIDELIPKPSQILLIHENCVFPILIHILLEFTFKFIKKLKGRNVWNILF